MLVPGSALVKVALGTNPLPQTPKEWASLAMEAGFDFIPCGKILKLVAGPAKPFLRKKIKGCIVKLLKKRSKKIKKLINQGAEAILENGYYEVNGFKFSEYYYEKLWQTGRKAPSLIAKEVLEGAKRIIPHTTKQGFFIYEYGGWEMVYDPISKEVWHLMPK